MYPPHHFGGYELVWRSAMRHLRDRGHEVEVLTTDLRTESREPDDPGVHRELRWAWGSGGFARLRPSRAPGDDAPQPPCARAPAERAAPRRRLVVVDGRAVAHDDRGRAPPRAAGRRIRARRLARLRTARGRLAAGCSAVARPWLAARRAPRRRARRRVELGDGGALGVRQRVAAAPGRGSRAGPRAHGGRALRDRPDLPRPRARARLGGGGSSTSAASTSARACTPRSRRSRTCPGGAAHRHRRLGRATRSARLRDAGGPPRRRRSGCDSRASSTASGCRPPTRPPTRWSSRSIWEEPWGLVPLEAMAIGRPVVATGRGGSARVPARRRELRAVPRRERRSACRRRPTAGERSRSARRPSARPGSRRPRATPRARSTRPSSASCARRRARRAYADLRGLAAPTRRPAHAASRSRDDGERRIPRS